MARYFQKRRTYWEAWVLVVVALVTIGGCHWSEQSSSTSRSEGAVEKEKKKPSDYHFQLKYEDMWGVTTLMVNGFPIHQSGGGHITNNPVLEIGLNTGLVEERNEVSIQVEPMLLRGGKAGLSIGSAKVYGNVTRDHHGKFKVEGAKISRTEMDSAYAAWSERVRSRYVEYLSQNEGSALDSIRAWASRNPMTVSTTFDNETGPDFSRIFEEAPRLADTPATRERLKDYAMHLRDLMAEKDTSALVTEFRPSIEYAYRQGKREGESLEEFVAMYRKRLVLDGAEKELSFSREEVRLSRWSDGRVWELRRKGAEGLLRRIKVYVAELDGELKVVR